MIELNVDDKESYSGGVITTNAVMAAMGFDKNDIIRFFDEIKTAEEKYYKKTISSFVPKQSISAASFPLFLALCTT